MYSHTFFVTSVRASLFLPQMAAKASDNCFGAKMPFPAFFWANATLLLAAFRDALPKRRFSAVRFLSSAFVIVVFMVFVGATVVFVVVVVIAMEG